jgi:hypothetical protein
MVCVDQMHKISLLQYEIFKLLSSGISSIVVAGDINEFVSI